MTRPVAIPVSFLRPSGGHLQFGLEAMATLTSFIQDDPDSLEAGGVLLGRHLLDSDDLIVDKVTTPMPGDRRYRSGFLRSAASHQQIIDQAWRGSRGTCTFLGEWHTHAEPLPEPSILDQRDWQRKALKDQFSQVIFFVILGTDAMCAWEARYRKTQLAPLLGPFKVYPRIADAD